MDKNNPVKKPAAKSVRSPAPAKKATTGRPATAKSTPAPKPVAAKQKTVPAKAKPAPDAAAEKLKPAVSALNGNTEKPVAPAGKPPAKAKPVAEHKEKIKKPKLVRDSFTMPEVEYQVLADVKKACIKAGFEIKKSELLRIGVAMIQKLDTVKLKEALAALQPLKAGRPKKDK